MKNIETKNFKKMAQHEVAGPATWPVENKYSETMGDLMEVEVGQGFQSSTGEMLMIECDFSYTSSHIGKWGEEEGEVHNIEIKAFNEEYQEIYGTLTPQDQIKVNQMSYQKAIEWVQELETERYEDHVG